MKQCFYLFFTLFCLGCETIEKEAEINLELQASHINENLKSNYTQSFDIKIECRGGCENSESACQVIGSGPLGSPGTMECSCSGCEMHFELTEEGSKNFTNEGDALRRLSEFDLAWTDINKFLRQNYNLESPSYDKIEFKFEKDVLITKVHFKDKESNNGSILLVQTSSKKFIVDCKGDCGCREIFNPATGDISCSCDECKMTVEELTESPD